MLIVLFELLLLYISDTLLLQINRKKFGDEFPYFPCYNGTIIVLNDETHSLRCTRTAIQAGCDLLLSHTDKVGFIPGNRDKFDKTLHIWPSKRIFPFENAFCSVNYKPTVGEIHLQDYPSNIYADVWNKETGVKLVNQSLVYKLIENTKIIFEVSTHWTGLLVKLHIDCLDNRGIKDTSSATRRCAIFKYEGDVKFPIADGIFKNLTTNSPVPSIVTTTSTNSKTAVFADAQLSDLGSPFFIAIVISITLGLFVVVVCFGIWVACNRYKQRKQQQLPLHNSTKVEVGNEAGSSRMTFKDMGMSPIINVDTNRPSNHFRSSNSRNRSKSNSLKITPNVATIQLQDASFNESDDYLDDKYTPPLDFNSNQNQPDNQFYNDKNTVRKMSKNNFNFNSKRNSHNNEINENEFFYDKNIGGGRSKINSKNNSLNNDTNNEYVIDKNIVGRMSKNNFKVNRGKIRKNVQEFDVFESPMHVENLKNIIEKTPSHHSNIQAIYKVSPYKNETECSSNPYKNESRLDHSLYTTEAEFDISPYKSDVETNLADSGGNVFASEIKNVLNEINNAYNSGEETLESETLRHQGGEDESTIRQDTPSQFEMDASSDTIDAMFALDEYEDESTLGESQELAMDFNATKESLKTPVDYKKMYETQESGEEINFEPYAFRGVSQMKSNPLFNQFNLKTNNEDSSQKTDVFF